MLKLNEELKENLRDTMVKKYRQPEQDHVTKAVDKLQQEVRHLCPCRNMFILEK